MAHRLGKVETLPARASTAMQWAFDAVRLNRMTQLDVLDQLNVRLAELGIASLSKSSFNRFAIKVRAGAIKRPVTLGDTPPTSATASEGEEPGEILKATEILDILAGLTVGQAERALAKATIMLKENVQRPA
jgi:hypothetical protein